MINSAWFYSLISVFIISLISLVGVFTIAIKTEKLNKVLFFLISFAAGALLADVFIHLLPEIIANKEFNLNTSLFILFGIMLFFILEKIICWRHCHIPTSKSHPHILGLMNLLGDSLHNFIDGVIIAVSFMTSYALGIATTIAIIFHEIPQEIGDFSVLLYAGYSKKKALIFNFLSACAAILGTILALTIGLRFSRLSDYIIPIASGGFIYIASADLIPELKKEQQLKKTISQLVGLFMGIIIMLLLKKVG